MAYLDGVASSGSEPRPIADAAGLALPQMTEERRHWLAEAKRLDTIKHLSLDGFATFTTRDQNLVDFSLESMLGSLAKIGCDPGDVDAVVFSTESFWDDPPGNEDNPSRHFSLRNRIVRSLSEAGLVNAVPYGNWLSACANFGTSLTLAQSLVDSGQHERVLVAVVDRLNQRVPRLMHNGSAVVSDVATSCFIQRSPAGFRIVKSLNVSAPKVAKFDNEERNDLGKLIFETLKALKRLLFLFQAATGRSPGDYEHIVASNFHRLSLQVVTDALKIAPGNIRRDSRREFGHGHASDNLLTLGMLIDSGEISPGGEVLLLSTGVWTWSLAILERVG